MQGGVKEPQGEGGDLPLAGTTARNAGLPPMDPELLQQFQVFAYFMQQQQLQQQQQRQQGTMAAIGPVVQEPSSQEGGKGRVGGTATSRDGRSHEWRLVARENEGRPGRGGERRKLREEEMIATCQVREVMTIAASLGPTIPRRYVGPFLP
jgi:hypothetical protein